MVYQAKGRADSLLMCMGDRPWVPGCHVEADPWGLLLNQTPLTLTNSWLVFAPLLIFRTFISLDAPSSQLLLALNTLAMDTIL